MTRPYAPSLIAGLALISTQALCAESAKLKCEEWHPRLGQSADKVVSIDFEAKTCNGQPCSISDVEFKWQEQNGRYESIVNRRTGEGTFFFQGDLLFSYKNCTLTASQ